MNRFLLAMSNMLAVSEQTLQEVSDKVHTILKTIAGPILIVLGSMGVIYMVVMGVQYAKSENEEKRGAIKKRLVNTLIGVLAIFALTALCLITNWAKIVPDLFGYMVTDK